MFLFSVSLLFQPISENLGLESNFLPDEGNQYYEDAFAQAEFASYKWARGQKKRWQKLS